MIADKIKKMAENSNTEFKTCSEGRLPNDLGEVVSAFSNTDGGRIILGATPDGDLAGLNSQQIDKLQQDLASLCANGFNIIILPEIIHADGVLIAEICQPLRP